MKYTIVATLVFSFGFLLFSPSPVQAATYQVTKEADTADGSCDSDCSLREAVIAANGGGEDIIVIPEGTYQLTRVGDDNTSALGDLDFTDSDQTLVFGAGAGIDDTVGTLIDAEDNDRVVNVRPGARLWMNDLTVLDGNVDAQGESGAGILNEGYVTLSSVWVYGNTLQTAASTNGYGAGIYCSGSSLFIENSQITNNIGTNVSGNVYGGGVPIAPTCDATVNISTISNNAAYAGGGLYVLTDANTVNLNDVSVTDNAVDWTGGGLHVEGADGANPVNVSRALFQDNDADSAGGGVFATGPLNIVNASFYGNHAGDAGGAFGTDSFTSPRINLAFVTMTRNTADSAAPGLYVGGATPDTHLKNSVIARNNHTGDIESLEDCSGVPISDDYNYVAATASCDMIPAEHDIVGTEAGSVYFTATPSDQGGNVFVTALWETGVTLDRIPEADCTDGEDVPVTSDARITTRPQNTRCDLGAFEKTDTVTQSPLLTSPTTGAASTLQLQYTLPETPSVATVTITNGSSVTRVLTMQAITSVNTTVNLASLASTTNVTGVAGGASLPDGTYTVTLSYQDALENTAATASASGVVIDTVTQTPILTSPATSTINTVNLQYTVPEVPLTGTVTVLFTNTTTSAVTTFNMRDDQSVNITFDPTDSGNAVNFDNITKINTISPSAMPVLADGTYTVTLRYRDALGNALVSTSAANVVIDANTQAPVLTAPATSAKLNSPALAYTLPETPQTGTVRVVFFDGSTTTTLAMDDSTSIETSLQLSSLNTTSHVSSSTATTLADGTYTVTVQYQDALGNPAVSTIATGVTIDTTAPVITLLGSTTTTLTLGDSYTDPGFTATDAIDGDLHDSVVVLNTVNTNVVGAYTIYYTLTDGAGNVATQQTRAVTVIPPPPATETPSEETSDEETPAPTVTNHGKITKVTVKNNRMSVTYADRAKQTVTPFGASKNFRYALSTDKKRLVVTNGKEIRVFVNGRKVATKKLNSTTYKKEQYAISIKRLFSGYDTVVVSAVKGKSGRVSVSRLTSAHAITTVKTGKTTIQSPSPLGITFNTSKKRITTTFGSRTKKTSATWTLRSNGALVAVKK